MASSLVNPCWNQPLLQKLSPLNNRRLESDLNFSCAENDHHNLFFPSKKIQLQQVSFFIRVFFHRHWQFTGQQEKGGDHRLFHSTTSTRSQTFRHLFATLHVRWLSRIFNCNACVYQTATRWDLSPYRITIWLIDWWCNVCFFTGWLDSRFLSQRFWHWKPVDLNSHRLTLYYKRTD